MKLLICDDDISTIDVIQSQLDYQELGIEEILRAYNGQAALEIIDKERPELVLCDIEMPILNGIDVLKEVRRKEIQVEFAFISNYESFEFAKEAIRYGVTSYITKPIDIKELREVLLTMIREAEKKTSAFAASEDKEMSDLHINDVFRRVRDGILGTDVKKIDDLLRRTGAGFSADSMWRIVYMSGEITNALRDGWTRDALTYSLGRLTEEVLTENIGNVYTLTDHNNRYTYVGCFIPAQTLAEKDLQQRCYQLVHLCSVHYSLEPVCMIGEEVPFYKTADVVSLLRAKLKKLRFQKGNVYLLSEKIEMKETPPRINEECAIRFIRENKRDEFVELVMSQMEIVAHTRYGDDSMVVQLHQDLLSAFYVCLKDNGISVRALLDDTEMLELDQRAEDSVPDILAFAKGFFDKTVQMLEGRKNSGDAVAVAKAYIQNHYRENINRDQIASIAFITPNYLSKRFSAEVGINIREYVNEIRVDEAKRLLITTDKTISEIAGEVGFDNISYFSTVFKRICGMSPVDWRSWKGESNK